MGVSSLTNSTARVDQAVSAVFSGILPNGTGLVYSAGNQTITGAKTFAGNLIAAGNLSATGVSGDFLPSISGGSNVGSVARPFNTGNFKEVCATIGTFGTIDASVINGNLNLSTTGLNNLTSTGTAYLQNIRVSGTTFLNGAVSVTGNINSSGTNLWGGQNTFVSSNFRGATFFEAATITSGVATFANVVLSGPLTGTSIYQVGSATLSGALSHSGSLSQVGNSTFVGNIGINGSTIFTGSVGVTGGSVTVRASTLFTTGNSASDRFGINQNVDVTGDANITGTVKISAALNVTGNQTNLGTLTVRNTGYFNSLSVSNTVAASGSALTGNNSISGTNSIKGSTTLSDTVIVDTYLGMKVVASGRGTNNVNATGATPLSLSNFWINGNAIGGTGIWRTAYVGRMGEAVILLTGSTTSTLFNNNMSLGTCGRAIQLVYAGTTNGSGDWTPLGV